ncbi:MAG: hypothetical protein ACRYGA_15640 [Janthinobacterium lividum]
MSLSPRTRAVFFASVLCACTASFLFTAPNAVAASSSTSTWRCGNAYADHPCEGGRRIETDDQRSAENRSAADAATLRMQRQADAMARDRERLENSAARGNVTVIADPRIAERRERLALQAAQRKIDREDEARRQPRTIHDKRTKVRSAR